MEQTIKLRSVLVLGVLVISAGLSMAEHKELKQGSFKEISQKLLILKRKTGPFGFPQDLTIKKIIKTHAKVIQKNEFPKAISKIKINAVFGRTFLVGSKEYKEGGTFPLEYLGKIYTIKVISVRTSKIVFKNMTTGQVIARDMNAMPAGFQRGSGKRKFPGFVPEGKARVIKVE